jgi:hypothetical protein
VHMLISYCKLKYFVTDLCRKAEQWRLSAVSNDAVAGSVKAKITTNSMLNIHNIARIPD